MAVPKIRFPGFTDAWEQRKLGQIIEVKPFKPYIAEANNTGKYPVIQQGDKPLLGYSDKNEPFRDYKSVTLFGDHTLSLFKPLEPFFVATDGIKILSSAMYGLFFYYLLDRYKPHSEGYKRHFSILKEQDCWITSQNEQEKIGNFFFGIDQAITLHQRKLESMKLLKKSLLQKMFPKSGETVPEVRFPGFTDAWEQRKLGELGTTYTGISGKTSSDFGHGDARFITYMNVYSNAIANPLMVEPIEIDQKQNEVKVGDVFFTTSSETPDEVGMSSVLLEKQGTVYLNSFCFGYRPKEKIDLHYLAFMLRSEVVRKKIIFLAQGISRYNISKNKMMEISVPLPTIEEQSKIGGFLNNLDNLITLHQRKVEALQKLKKSLLQQMFV